MIHKNGEALLQLHDIYIELSTGTPQAHSVSMPSTLRPRWIRNLQKKLDELEKEVDAPSLLPPPAAVAIALGVM